MPLPPIINQLRDRIVSARRKLLRRIDKRLASPACDASVLVETMCAYALATSDTPTQVLRHFHKIRLDSIMALLRRGLDELARHGTSALRLCIQTCQDTQAAFPRRLAESLAKLKVRPLVQDADVRALDELNLHVHDRWFADKARDYTPQPRHDELQRADAEKILHQWSKQAMAAFLGAIKTALTHEHRLEEVARLRRELVETWILSGTRMAGVKTANVLDDLRDTMNSHLETIITSRTQDLKAIVSEVSRTLSAWRATTPPSGLALWDNMSKSSHLGNGAVTFKISILDTHQGRDELVAKVVSSFDAWTASVLQTKGIVKSMKDARWDDTFADDVDGSDDEDFGESRQTLLSDDDPRFLEEVTQLALARALHNLGTIFLQFVEELTGGDQEGKLKQICFLLRVMREIGERVPTLKLQDRATPPSTPFTMELIGPLHAVLAGQIVQSSTKAYRRSLKYALEMTSNSHILWEGQPPLPAQPSPSAYRYLQNLTKTMAGHGSDLWAPGCVSVLKESACQTVSAVLQECLDEISDGANAPQSADKLKEDREHGSTGETNIPSQDPEVQSAGNDQEKAIPSAATTVETKDRKTKQIAFDALYLQRFLGDARHDDPIDRLFEDLNDLDATSMARLRKSAADYAKKTYLLFALLA